MRDGVEEIAMRITYDEAETFGMVVGYEPWDHVHIVAALYTAMRSSEPAVTRRTTVLLDDHFLMTNLEKGISKMRLWNGCNYVRQAFWTYSFKLLRAWLLESQKARYHVLHSQMILDTLLPICHYGSRSFLSPDTKISLSNVLLVFLDGVYNKFFYVYSQEKVEAVAGGLFKLIYPIEDAEISKGLPMPTFFELVKREKISFSKNEFSSRVVMNTYMYNVWFDLLKRAQVLWKETTQIRVVEMLEEYYTFTEKQVLGRKIAALVAVTEFMEEQENMEKSCILVGLSIGRTLMMKEYLDLDEARRPPEPPTLGESNFMSDSVFFASHLLSFCNAERKPIRRH